MFVDFSPTRILSSCVECSKSHKLGSIETKIHFPQQKWNKKVTRFLAWVARWSHVCVVVVEDPHPHLSQDPLTLVGAPLFEHGTNGLAALTLIDALFCLYFLTKQNRDTNFYLCVKVLLVKRRMRIFLFSSRGQSRQSWKSSSFTWRTSLTYHWIGLSSKSSQVLTISRKDAGNISEQSQQLRRKERTRDLAKSKKVKVLRCHHRRAGGWEGWYLDFWLGERWGGGKVKVSSSLNQGLLEYYFARFSKAVKQRRTNPPWEERKTSKRPSSCLLFFSRYLKADCSEVTVKQASVFN